MPVLADTLNQWHDFYALVGTASATLIGLLFVAASVGSGVFSPERPVAVRAFLSSSVVHFTCALAACLLVLAPLGAWRLLGALAGGAGLLGLIYAGLVWRAMARDGFTATLDVADRFWYAQLPPIAYATFAASGAMFFERMPSGCALLALSVGLLLLTGIRNAWDITIWAMTRRGGGR